MGTAGDFVMSVQTFGRDHFGRAAPEGPGNIAPGVNPGVRSNGASAEALKERQEPSAGIVSLPSATASQFDPTALGGSPGLAPGALLCGPFRAGALPTVGSLQTPRVCGLRRRLGL